MTSDPGAKEKFHAIGEAYNVLGNERQRYSLLSFTSYEQ